MVRELFVMAREHAPSIIFMDEIDSIGSSRVEGSSGGDSEVQRTMLELLNQLDGFEPTKNIKIIMATNRLDIPRPCVATTRTYRPQDRVPPTQRRGACRHSAHSQQEDEPDPWHQPEQDCREDERLPGSRAEGCLHGSWHVRAA